MPRVLIDTTTVHMFISCSEHNKTRVLLFFLENKLRSFGNEWHRARFAVRASIAFVTFLTLEDGFVLTFSVIDMLG